MGGRDERRQTSASAWNRLHFGGDLYSQMRDNLNSALGKCKDYARFGEILRWRSAALCGCGIICFHEISRTFTSSNPFPPCLRLPSRAIYPSRYNLHLCFERMEAVQYVWADERINPVIIAGYRGFRLLSKDNYKITSCLHSH